MCVVVWCAVLGLNLNWVKVGSAETGNSKANLNEKSTDRHTRMYGRCRTMDGNGTMRVGSSFEHLGARWTNNGDR